MLGRKDFTADEVRHARESVEQVLTAFAAAGSPAAVEQQLFTQALIALDRRFVHRVRLVAGKAGTPVNEVELLVASLIDHDGRLEVGTVVKYDQQTSVLGLAPGDPIVLDAASFRRLTDAFFADLESKFR